MNSLTSVSDINLRLFDILNNAKECLSRYPTEEEQKQHILQYNEPSVHDLLNGVDTLSDCFRMILALLLQTIPDNISKICPGKYPGIIPFLFPPTKDIHRGSVIYIENTLLLEYGCAANKFYSRSIGCWAISFGLGSDLNINEVKYYKNNRCTKIEDNVQYLLAFIGIGNRRVQLIKLDDLIERITKTGDKHLEQSDISEKLKQEYFEKRSNTNIQIKIQGNVASYTPENIQTYINKTNKKYQFIRHQIDGSLGGNIKNLTCEYLNFLRIYTEATSTNSYQHLLHNLSVDKNKN